MSSKGKSPSKKKSASAKPKGEKPQKSPDIPILRTEGFRKSYGTRALAIRTEYDFRAILANEKMMRDDGDEFFVGESMFILTPIATKELHKQLGKLIKEWEQEYGAIEKRPKTTIYSEQCLP